MINPEYCQSACARLEAANEQATISTARSLEGELPAAKQSIPPELTDGRLYKARGERSDFIVAHTDEEKKKLQCGLGAGA